MKINFLLIIIAVFVGKNACLSQGMAANSNTTVSLRLNLNEATGVAEKDLFDSVRFIPLETNAKSLFGHVSQLEVTNDYFIILDGDTNCILFFDKNGKFHAKIDGGSKQLNPRVIIPRLTVNRFEKKVLFRTLANDFYYTYDFNGVKKGEEPVRSTKMKDPMCFLPSGDFVISNNYGRTRGKPGNFLSFVKKNDIYATALPYSDADYLNGDVAGRSGFYYGKGNNTLLYTKPYDYSVYSITSQNAKIDYRFIFTIDNALPNDFLSNPAYADKRQAFVKENFTKVFSLTNCFQVNDYLFFKANSYGNSGSQNFLYNLKSRRLIAYDKITPDETSYYLPVAFNGLDYVNNGLAIGEDGYIYTNISSLDLLTSQNKLKNKNADLNPELAKFMEKKDKQSNPVMIQIHLKG